MAQGIRGTKNGIVDLCDVFSRLETKKTIKIFRKTDSIKKNQECLESKELGIKISPVDD